MKNLSLLVAIIATTLLASTAEAKKIQVVRSSGGKVVAAPGVDLDERITVLVNEVQAFGGMVMYADHSKGCAVFTANQFPLGVDLDADTTAGPFTKAPLTTCEAANKGFIVGDKPLDNETVPLHCLVLARYGKDGKADVQLTSLSDADTLCIDKKEDLGNWLQREFGVPAAWIDGIPRHRPLTLYARGRKDSLDRWRIEGSDGVSVDALTPKDIDAAIQVGSTKVEESKGTTSRGWGIAGSLLSVVLFSFAFRRLWRNVMSRRRGATYVVTRIPLWGWVVIGVGGVVLSFLGFALIGYKATLLLVFLLILVMEWASSTQRPAGAHAHAAGEAAHP